MLTHSPLIGRKVQGGKRELVIARGSRGYLALYRHVADIDTAFVLAVRSQREAGARVPAPPAPGNRPEPPTAQPKHPHVTKLPREVASQATYPMQ